MFFRKCPGLRAPGVFRLANEVSGIDRYDRHMAVVGEL
jgi:hypothetical protein